MTTKEFLQRESALALRFGIRKTDAYYQLVRCTACGNEALLRNRYSGRAFSSVDEVEEEMLAQIQREIRAACVSCGARPLRGDGSRHVFLLYSERRAAHAAITLSLEREDDGRVKVKRQVWFVPVDGGSEEIERDDDPRLGDVWLDSAIRRWSLDSDPMEASRALEEIADEHPRDAFALRELGQALLDAGQAGRALEVLERCLEADPEQPVVMQRLGRLYAAFGRAAEGSELLVRAFELVDDDTLLPEILKTAYRGGRRGALQKAAHLLLEREPESVVAHKALVTLESLRDVGAARDAWERLREVAERAGERWTEAVARGWCGALDLPLPDWWEGWSAADYVAAVASECLSLDLEVDPDPDPLQWGGASIPVALEVDDAHGTTWLFVLADHESTPVGDLTIAASARAAHHDARRGECRVLPISRAPLSYAAARWCSGASDALIDVLADADTTMTVVDENVASFVQAAEQGFGRTLEFDTDSLTDVDAIVARYFDDGFGAMTYALRCQIAAYVGAVVGALLPGAQWESADPPMDPRVLRLPGGGEMNLIGKIERAVQNGEEDALTHFVQVVVHQLATLPEEEGS